MKTVKILTLLSLALLVTSCFKKLDGADTLNNNIYDREYAGDVWFEIENTQETLDQFGNPTVVINIIVPEDATPEFKATNFYYEASVNDVNFGLNYSPREEEGHYLINLVLSPEPSETYDVTLGVWIDDDQESINTFTETVSTL